jgi:hypothetical protein
MAPDEAHELHEWADRLIPQHSEDQIA